jgi:hypothetical protein
VRELDTLERREAPSLLWSESGSTLERLDNGLARQQTGYTIG